MKKLFTLTELLLVCILLALLALFALPAKAQVPSPYQTGAPNFVTKESVLLPVTLATQTATNIVAGSTNSVVKTLRQDHGVSLVCTIVATNTSPVMFSFDITADGSLYTTTKPITWTVPGATGTNTYWTNFPHTVLNNVRKVQCTQVTNASAYTVTVQTLQYSQSGNTP